MGVFVQIGFAGLLALAFIVLKLLHVIAWPWLWVLAPIWLPPVVFLVVLFMMLILSIVGGNR